jgi:hypothetical protein
MFSPFSLLASVQVSFSLRRDLGRTLGFDRQVAGTRQPRTHVRFDKPTQGAWLL